VLDYVTWGEVLKNPYNGWFLARLEVTHAMAKSRAQCWFLALLS